MSDAKSQKTKKPINQNLTVPNAMSVFRILVIPFFAYFFLKGNLTHALDVLLRTFVVDRPLGAVRLAENHLEGVLAAVEPEEVEPTPPKKASTLR